MKDTVSPERWRQISELYRAVLERPAVERAAVLAEADPELREHVESLLAHSKDGLLDRPLIDSPESTVEKPAVGAQLGPYKIEALLGSGGMGQVYRAMDTRLRRSVAIKVAHAQFSARFEREARAIAALNHPHICTVHDVGPNYLVMELVEGETLSARLKRGKLSIEDTLRYGAQIAGALAAAHARGIIHRDLKPGNIMIGINEIKVLDFGLARLEQATDTGPFSEQTETVTQGIVGTVPYMSPEQLQGKELDARTDLFSLGATLFEMATGQKPFEGESTAVLAGAILNKSPIPPSRVNPELPAELERTILRALEKDREVRYQTASDVRAELERQRRERDSGRLAVVHASEERRSTTYKKTPVRLIGLGVLLLAALLVVTYFWYGRRHPTQMAHASLAILPFRVLSASDEDGHLAVGIPDALITRVANAGRLRVRPTNAILRYEREQPDPRVTGQSLHCDYLLFGTVQPSAGRVRVNVQLLRTSDGSTVWGKTFDLARSDLLGLEDSIVQQLVSALQVQITVAERERLYHRYTQNAAAYDLYLKGRSKLLKNPEGAIAAFEAALRIDPNYALAHAGIAFACTIMRIGNARPAEAPQWERRASTEAQRALALDPDLAEAHEAQCSVYRYSDFDWERTLEECSRALELNPSLYTPHRYRADAFRHLGLLDLVEPEIRAARDNNPNPNEADASLLGATALWDGRFSDVEPLTRQSQGLGNSLKPNLYLAEAWFYLGQRSRAEAMLLEQHAPTVSGRMADAARASFLASEGRKNEAKTLLRTVIADDVKEHHANYSIGVTYAQLGDTPNAVRWLKRSASEGFVCYPWYARDPLLKTLRKDPAFLQLLQDLRNSWAAAKARFGSHAEAPQG